MKEIRQPRTAVCLLIARRRTGEKSLRYGWVAGLCTMMIFALIPIAGRTQTTSDQKAAIVLVHGAWADASSFDAVARE